MTSFSLPLCVKLSEAGGRKAEFCLHWQQNAGLLDRGRFFSSLKRALLLCRGSLEDQGEAGSRNLRGVGEQQKTGPSSDVPGVVFASFLRASGRAEKFRIQGARKQSGRSGEEIAREQGVDLHCSTAVMTPTSQCPPRPGARNNSSNCDHVFHYFRPTKLYCTK